VHARETQRGHEVGPSRCDALGPGCSGHHDVQQGHAQNRVLPDSAKATLQLHIARVSSNGLHVEPGAASQLLDLVRVGYKELAANGPGKERAVPQPLVRARWL